MAETSQSGFQVGRRKPVIQDGPGGEVLSGSPGAGFDRVGEITNSRFVEAKQVEQGERDQMRRRQQPYHFGAIALMALARAEWVMVPSGPAGKLARTDARTFSRSLSDSAAIALPVGW